MFETQVAAELAGRTNLRHWKAPLQLATARSSRSVGASEVSTASNGRKSSKEKGRTGGSRENGSDGKERGGGEREGGKHGEVDRGEDVWERERERR